jgi:ankyrin repeat protein
MPVKHRVAWWTPLVLSLLALANLAAAAVDVPLVDAVKSADTATVRALLEQRIDVNASEADGTTALHWAAYKGDVESAQLLLRAGADAEARNSRGVTPLVLASSRGIAPIVEALLVAGADPNTSLPEGETVLMAAARTGNVDVLRLLLAAGADLSARESWRDQTALMWAAGENHRAAVLMLIELGANVNERSTGGWTSLLFAARAGNVEAVQALLEAGADVNDAIRPLNAEAAPPEGAPNQYRRRSDPTGTSALVLAVYNGHFSLAKYLVEQGADANAAEGGWTALHQLAYTRRPNTGKGMPPVVRRNPLDTLELAEFLLMNGADPNLRQTKRHNNRERNNLNRIGATPYLIAAKHADPPFMRLMAAHGADTQMPTEENVSPLMAAAGVGIFNLGESAGTNEEAFETVQLAYELGSQDVNQASSDGYTALHGAALRGADPVVQFLVDKGAELLPKTTKEGWTPLRIADGVHYTGTVKRADHTAELLRTLMKEQGVYVDGEHTKDVNSVAVVKPTP